MISRRKAKEWKTLDAWDKNWFEEAIKQLKARDEENTNLKSRIAELEKQQGEYNEI